MLLVMTARFVTALVREALWGGVVVGYHAMWCPRLAAHRAESVHRA